MAKRGILAEIQHQSRLAAKEKERQRKAAVREHNAAVRRAEQAQRKAQQARAQMAKAADADRKAREKAVKEAHIESMQADVEERNSAIAEAYDEIDNLLAATLDVDDYVDLEALRAPVVHPPFDARGLDQPVPEPAPIPDPVQPVLVPPESPKGLFGKKKHEQAAAEAQLLHNQALQRWQVEIQAARTQRESLYVQYQQNEAKRIAGLQQLQALYKAECDSRDKATNQRNELLDQLIVNLGYGTPEAISEYVSIVLSNSVYPKYFQVEHDFDFDAATAELTLQVTVPNPETLPKVKAFKYTKSTDEVSSTDLSQKAQKDRYASAVHQVALRTLHEVFEADRRGLIGSISLQVGTRAADPATGLQGFLSFVGVAAERSTFMNINLHNVVPTATLEHLGATVSKNPHGLVGVSSKGVRRS